MDVLLEQRQLMAPELPAPPVDALSATKAGLDVYQRREEILVRSATVGTAALQALHHVLLEHEPVTDSAPLPVCSTCRGADGSRLTYPCRTSDVVQGALGAALLPPER
jgi:hypothetical protein